MSKAWSLAALAGLAAVIAGCGGNSDTTGLVGNENPRIRTVVAFPDIDAVDVFVSSDHTQDDAAFGTFSDYTIEDNGNRTVRFLDAASQGELVSHESLFEENTHYTVIGTGTGTAGRSVIKLTDGRDAPSGGRGKVRVVNAAQNLNTLDVYITPSGGSGDLTGVTPTADNVAFGDDSTEYVFLDPGTYRVRVTEDDNQTVLLDTNLTIQVGFIRTILMLQGQSGPTIVVLEDRG